MRIGIIGAGFTGLACAIYLQKKGHNITIFESDNKPGGLAVGFENPSWRWSLERHYHHLFTNDHAIKNLAKIINFPLTTKRVPTSILLNDNIYQLDSPFKLLSFSKLSIINRLRMAFVLGILKYNPLWKPLEKFSAERSLEILMGKKAYQMIWGAQMNAKFGKYAKDISLAWFWARIRKRTPSLSYPQKGFLAFSKALEKHIEQMGGEIFYESPVTKIKGGNKVSITIDNKGQSKKIIFDKLVVTLPTPLFEKLAKGQLPKDYLSKIATLKGLGAINMILRLKKPFLENGTYWLSICENDYPFTAIVEHTNFIDKKNYNNEYILYVGKYASVDHYFFTKSKDELLNIYTPFLKRINKNFKKNIIDFEVFKTPFAQPIIPLNYSKIILPFKTPIKNVYLANIQQVYPWDRGTNYAVELGKKIADIIA